MPENDRGVHRVIAHPCRHPKKMNVKIIHIIMILTSHNDPWRATYQEKDFIKNYLPPRAVYPQPEPPAVPLLPTWRNRNRPLRLSQENHPLMTNYKDISIRNGKRNHPGDSRLVTTVPSRWNLPLIPNPSIPRVPNPVGSPKRHQPRRHDANTILLLPILQRLPLWLGIHSPVRV